MKLTISILIFLSGLINAASGQTKKDSLLVFVGEKISVTIDTSDRKKISAPDTTIDGKDTLVMRQISISMDLKYVVKYKILKQIYGNYQKDTIEFIAFDHYGKPGFSNYNTVLLFVSLNEDGRFYHEKYQYFDLYLAKNGKWASPYSSGDYNHPFKEKITVKPEIIEFTTQVSYSVERLTKNQIAIRFPAPYYKIENRKAIAVYGNYIDDLFTLKQQTILKARGIY